MSEAKEAGRDFIRQIIDRDMERGTYGGRVVTRFPPEPNGYLHIGHAKSIQLNFGIAEEYGGRCHLRFDDTNPATEEREYVGAIEEDVRWLGFDWGEHLYHAADYFDRMYEYAEMLIEKGLAYVDSQDEEAIREGRGTVTEPGTPSPDRERPAEDHLDLFRRMRAGEFGDGEYVLRAKIDLGSPNMLMRDPILYRIRHQPHHRSGDAWCIYPLYDYAHCLEDAIEGVTHSLCTLEFANNRELYDWILDNVGIEEPRPHQYEFGKGLLDYTITSKRKLLRLVREGYVHGWDDPRMPTLAAFRRRGVPPGAIRAFWEMVGVARADARIDIGKLEYTVRDTLNRTAPRVLAVVDPLPVEITTWAEGREDEREAPYFPPDVDGQGSRTVRMGGELLIERDDFSEDPPPGFKRLVPGGEVRLRHACVIRCDEVVKDEAGRVTLLRCSHVPEDDEGPRTVKGAIHWVSAAHAVPCEVRLYDRLFSVPDPEAAAAESGDPDAFTDYLNPDSLRVMEDAWVEPSVLDDPRDTRYQFERLGYFWRDPADDRPDRPVFNRIVTLRDTWASRSAGRSAARDAAETPESEGPSAGAESPAEGSDEAVRPEVPPEIRRRAAEIAAKHGVGDVDAEILARDPERAAFLDELAAGWPAGSATDAADLANWVIHDLARVQDDRDIGDLPFGARELAGLVRLVDEGIVSRRAAGQVLDRMAVEGGDPAEIVEALDLAKLSDAEVLGAIVKELLDAYPEKVTEYRGGKGGLFGFFMGKLMARTGGRADPAVASEILRSSLGD